MPLHHELDTVSHRWLANPLLVTEDQVLEHSLQQFERFVFVHLALLDTLRFRLRAASALRDMHRFWLLLSDVGTDSASRLALVDHFLR